MNSLIIFDLDGVITSEEAYWDAAGLTLHELLYSPRYWNISGEKHYHPATTADESRRVSRSVFPEAEILTLKARAINSNWDTCYATVCLHLISLLAFLKQQSHALPRHLLPLQPWNPTWLAAFRKHLSDCHLHNPEKIKHAFVPVNNLISSPTFHGYVGLELINRFDTYATELLGIPVNKVFSRYSPFWAFCRDIFQEWYLGDDLYTQTYGHALTQSGKPGCIHFEHPLLPLAQERATLQTLLEQDYTLGFATGRVRQEAEYPLKMYDLLSYFDDRHISTYDDVEQAESVLRHRGNQTLLSKPHPFPFLRAVDPQYRQSMLQNPVSTQHPFPFIVIGDSTSDILGGRAAGALTIAVLTGARMPEARTLLAKSNPDFTIDDMTKLPALLANLDSLTTIQKLQFTEREKAERLLQLWFARYMHLNVNSITLTPRAVSLNSFNGFYRLNNDEYFFKTHVEEQGILEEYYHAELLHRSGYNIVLPLQTLHEKDQQMVIYPVIHWPAMFDLVRAIETNDTHNTPDSDAITIETIATAEQQACNHLLEIYASTLAFSTTEENARAPIHQLFWHRLTGGRFQTFYAGKQVPLPGEISRQSPNSAIPFDELLTYQWNINGVPQQKTLSELVERAIHLLNPAQPTRSIIGHGDAHFGNIFLETTKRQGEPGYPQGDTPTIHAGVYSRGIPLRVPWQHPEYRYLYFDPAFAGRHSPLLDIIKPLFHNIFATWMYFPHDIAQHLQVSVTIKNKNIYIEHTYALTPVRRAILQVKRDHLLTPLVAQLRSQNALPDDWMEFMQLALMCCPWLTINLLDAQRMPAAITWLGLAQAVQVGNTGIEQF